MGIELMQLIYRHGMEIGLSNAAGDHQRDRLPGAFFIAQDHLAQIIGIIFAGAGQIIFSQQATDSVRIVLLR